MRNVRMFFIQTKNCSFLDDDSVLQNTLQQIMPISNFNQFQLEVKICFNHYFFVKNNTLCSIALNSLITEPGLYVFWLEFQVVTQLSSAVLIVFRTVKRAIKDLRAEGVSLVLQCAIIRPKLDIFGRYQVQPYFDNLLEN